MEGFSEHQIAFVSVNYRLTNGADVFVRDCVTDAKDALRYLNKEAERYGFDPGKILVWGASAGAHLAMMLNHTGKDDFRGDDALFAYALKPAGAISWFGPTDLEFPGESGTDNLRMQEIRRRITLDDEAISEEAGKVSPIRYVDRNDPPVFLLQGDQDITVIPGHAYRMEKCLKRENADYRLLIVKNAGHGWKSTGTIDPSYDEIEKATVDYAVKLLTSDGSE
jgi:acetyl esterase/lipase